MASYAIEDATVKDIHDAICVKRGKTTRDDDGNYTYKILGERFDDEIYLIDRLKHMTAHEDIPRCNYGLLASYCACSYEIARYSWTNAGNSKQLFDYDTSNSPLSSNRNVRNGSGQCYIDCSTLVGLACRGIYYDDSPYSKHTGANATWNPSTEIAAMRSSWGFRALDRQPAGAYSDIGLGASVGGYSSIRTSADLAEYFYRAGKVIYEEKFEGELATDTQAQALIDKLAPGDLIFWSTYPDEADKKRFRMITHVAMVCAETKQFVEATGKVSTVVRRQNFLTDSNTHTNYEGVEETCQRYKHMVLAIRPNWGPQTAMDTPLNINLLRWPWSWGIWSKNTSSGVERTCVGTTRIQLVGKSTGATNWDLRGSSSDENDKILLTAGSYKMRLEASGNSFPASAGLALQLRTSSGADLSPTVRAYHGSDATINIPDDGFYVIYLHVNGSVTFDCTVDVSLVRTS